jgi:replicative DNA helicase
MLRAVGLSRGIIEGLLQNVNEARAMGLSAQEVTGIAASLAKYTPASENRLPQPDDVLTVADCRDKWEAQRRTAQHCCTGFARLDAAISVFHPGEVFTLAGRSGTGKTTLGLTLGRALADDLAGHCLFASLEMNAESVWYRLGTMHAGASGASANSSDVATRLQTAAFANAVEQRNGRLLVVDKDSQTVGQIEEHLLNARDKFGTVALVVLDYLGYLSDPGAGSTYERVSRIARAVKGLAKRQSIRVLLLCQTSREGGDGCEPVRLHHLRDSGAIEESADYVLGLWRDAEDPTRLHAEILKNRHGRQGGRLDFVNNGLHLVEADPTETRPRF